MEMTEIIEISELPKEDNPDTNLMEMSEWEDLEEEKIQVTRK